MIEGFLDRREAGHVLAGHLSQYAERDDVAVLALPRGGVPVAFEVARALHLPLDVLIVRKLGVPGHEELAMGAIASGGIRIVNEDVMRDMGISAPLLESVAVGEQSELTRREKVYRGDRPAVTVEGRTVLLIDDGLATGSTMRAAVAALRQRHPERIVVAVPVAARSTCEELKEEVDDVVCAITPTPFYGVGQWYENFSQTSDEEVKELLDRAFDPSHESKASTAARKRTITIGLPDANLVADLMVPPRAWGFVLFAHGSGSSRLSPRNQHVAALLREEGLATLLIDLLTVEEAVLDTRTMQFRFDVELLAQRLIGVTDWRTQDMEVAQLPLGYFGASTGSAAALIAASARPYDVEAVVSRGGRPDLATSSLARVRAPTLLIVGGEDVPVIELNQTAFDRLSGAKELSIVPGATHLFEEPGAMERVARLTVAWYRRHLR
jgi:putative phosphoribosyl transferase